MRSYRMDVETFYDDIADHYDELRYGSAYCRQISEIELDFIEPYLRGNCLEVGVGTGRVTRFLVERVDMVTAVDQSARMLEKLRHNLGPRKNLTTRVANIYELDQVEGYGQFGSVACFRVLPHLQDPLRALRALRDAVIAEGMVLFDLWNAWGYDALLKRLGLKKRAVYTNYISIRQMRLLIEASQLRVVACKGVGFPPWKWLLPLERSSFRGLHGMAQRILWVCQPR